MIVLASSSKARAGMLQAAGVELAVEPADIDEAAIKMAMLAEDAPPADIAATLAEVKAMRISNRRAGQMVVGADQILICEGRLFDKPKDLAEAKTHLETLRGKTHELLSAAVIVRDGEPIWRHVGKARLTMRPFSESFVQTYIAEVGDTILNSVGGYHLEGRGAQLFSRVEGDYFTILGLPLLELLGFLRVRGVLVE